MYRTSTGVVNRRLTQYGKARELKPFDEFVLFPLFLSSSWAFSYLKEVGAVERGYWSCWECELLLFRLSLSFGFSFSVWFPRVPLFFFLEWAVRTCLLFSKGSQKADKKLPYRFIPGFEELLWGWVRYVGVYSFELVLSPADLRLPLFRLKFLGLASYATVLDSDNVGYNMHWNWSQNNTRQRMTTRQFDNPGNRGEDAAYRRSYSKP